MCPKNGRKLTASLRSCYGNVDAAVHVFVRRQMLVVFVLYTQWLLIWNSERVNCTHLGWGHCINIHEGDWCEVLFTYLCAAKLKLLFLSYTQWLFIWNSERINGTHLGWGHCINIHEGNAFQVLIGCCLEGSIRSLRGAMIFGRWIVCSAFIVILFLC